MVDYQYFNPLQPGVLFSAFRFWPLGLTVGGAMNMDRQTIERRNPK
jgi:hypothetical protein